MERQVDPSSIDGSIESSLGSRWKIVFIVSTIIYRRVCQDEDRGSEVLQIERLRILDVVIVLS